MPGFRFFCDKAGGKGGGTGRDLEPALLFVRCDSRHGQWTEFLKQTHANYV
jgi:hypothetical protein